MPLYFVSTYKASINVSRINKRKKKKTIFLIAKVVQLGSTNVHFLVVSSNATISNGKSSPMAKLFTGTEKLVLERYS